VSRLAGPGLLVMLPKTKMERLLSLPAVLVTLLHLCMGDLHYKHYRLESLCKADSGKVRLRLGQSAATFQLNSSLVPGTQFNCHLELALDSSQFGFFVYFEELSISGSSDCEEDYVQFGRDILFITSYRSGKFCHRIQGAFPARNKSSGQVVPATVTPLSRRTYTELTDQEMDVWMKLQLSSSLATFKTVSFVVTPYKLSCRHQAGYRRCGGSGQCVRDHFFCDGWINCAANKAEWPSDETDCKPSSTAITDLDNSDWQQSKVLYISGPLLGLLLLVVFITVLYRRYPAILNLPASKPGHPGPAPHRVTQYRSTTGHIVQVPRPAPPIPTTDQSSLATAPPLPPCPPSYSDIVHT